MSDIRLADFEDAPELERISKSSMTSFWHKADFEDAIISQNAVVFVAVSDGQLAGYVVMYFAADEGEIPSVATHIDHRKRGIGSSLMNIIRSEAKKRNLSKIFLEVRVGNETAHRLYEKSGFIVSGTRKNFYDNPKEDADIMVCLL
ncbi:MAG: ribosomal protein S18-alanine N-acetyltransferase [Lachnospiraceae bacterium]|nr:ribosomal protein S18-alanine N-acetyltransferase [Lachnospiraceae bacterium]